MSIASPFSSPRRFLDPWSHFPYYTGLPAHPQGRSLQPSRYTYPLLYPHSPCPFRYQPPQLFSHYNAPSLPPVVNRGRSTDTETPQSSAVLGVHMHSELWWNRYWTDFSRGIIWDVALPPSAARLSTSRLNITQPNSEAPAIMTQRRINRIELWTDHPHLALYMRSWGPVSVSETSTPAILELLQAIYDYLNTPLTNEDFRSICSNPHNLGRLNVSRECRIQDGFDAVYTQGPFRRSDVIGGHRRFLGIRTVKMQDEILTLHFNLGPGPVPSFY
jgi:hypothetical protein